MNARFYRLSLIFLFSFLGAINLVYAYETPCSDLAEARVVDNSILPDFLLGEKRPALLSGGGDVVIKLSRKAYLEAKRAPQNASSGPENKGVKTEVPPTLYINGATLGKDVTLVREDVGPDCAYLRYRITPKEDSKQFWTTVYRDVDLFGAAQMNATVGWGDFRFPTVIAKDGEPSNYLRVGTPVGIVSAFALVLGLLLFFLWTLRDTDIFRVFKSDAFWRTAEKMQSDMSRQRALHAMQCTEQNRPTLDKAINFLELRFGFGYDKNSASPDDYRAAAKAALAGVIPSDERQKQVALLGLCLSADKWRTPRRPYSLSRVQIGVWTTFATTIAIFLWVVYGTFPVLAESMVYLLGISTATAAVSYFLEDKTLAQATGPSEGFFRDISTSWDGTQHIHRFQAIIVNVLLIIVGITYVVQHLGFPVFDSTWLQFLGLSGIAQAAGKTVENKVAVGTSSDTLSSVGNSAVPNPAGNEPPSDTSAFKGGRNL